MSDLVQRLREYSRDAMVQEAADCIERYEREVGRRALEYPSYTAAMERIEALEAALQYIRAKSVDTHIIEAAHRALWEGEAHRRALEANA